MAGANVDNSSNTPVKARLLLDELDMVLGRYLVLLDEHENLQRYLSKQFSKGFLSLSEANFKSPNRAQYGQDFYLNRMQASTIVDVSTAVSELEMSHAEGPEIIPPKFHIRARPTTLFTRSETKPDKAKTHKSQGKGHIPRTLTTRLDESISAQTAVKRVEQILVSTALPACEVTNSDGNAHQSPEKNLNLTKPRGMGIEGVTPLPDPLRQFGVLVAPALKTAQRTFRDEIVPGLVELLNIQWEIREMERLAGVKRKLISRANGERRGTSTVPS